MITATDDKLEIAEAFLLERWRERAAERGTPVPTDLSGACKFAAAFAQATFGGEIQAHDFHTWLVLDGEIVDLCRNAEDVREMADGRIPESQAEYARTFRIGFPRGGLYAADRAFMQLEGFRTALAANAPRVDRWVAAFPDWIMPE